MKVGIVMVLAGVALFLLASLLSPSARGAEGDKGTSITEVRLSDGTKCAVMDKSGAAAISCDWR